MTKQEIWGNALCAALRSGTGYTSSREIADTAAADFEAAFSEQPEPVGDFIKIPIKFTPEDDIVIPRKDADGFELPEWVKPGARCMFLGKERFIDFIGVDEAGVWNCRLAWAGDATEKQWAFVSNLKPYNG